MQCDCCMLNVNNESDQTCNVMLELEIHIVSLNNFIKLLINRFLQLSCLLHALLAWLPVN